MKESPSKSFHKNAIMRTCPKLPIPSGWGYPHPSSRGSSNQLTSSLVLVLHGCLQPRNPLPSKRVHAHVP